MKRSLRLSFAAVIAIPGLVLAQPASPPPAAPSAPPAADAQPYPEAPAVLPGKGLAQHDFLYTGEWDTRKDHQTMSLIRGGKVVWTYQIPTNDETNHQLSEFSDMHRLSNGDIVFAYKTGWRKIDAEGKTIYDYKCPKVEGPDGKDVLNSKKQPYYTECHSALPVGFDRVLFVRNGVPAKLFLYNLKTGQMEMEREVQTKYPGDPTHIHAQFRNIRMTKAGTYLLAHLDLGRVIEYDRNFKEIWSCDAPSVWQAVRLDNGNTMITGNQHAFVREISPDGKIVWEVNNGDLAGFRIDSVHQAQRLANGNTVITNWSGVLHNKADWPKVVQLMEVTPDKKVVWAINEWKNPDLGPASCIQLLDQPGRDEEHELMR